MHLRPLGDHMLVAPGKRSRLIVFLSLALSGFLAMSGRAEATPPRDGQHDFDFEIGTWKTHIARLAHPLSGSKKWVQLNGTSVVTKIWGGRANMVELEVDGPSGHLEGLSLRLYNPQTHQWSLNFASSRVGMLGQPTVGEFKNGRGVFYDREDFNGKPILVRNVWSNITPTSCRFVQSFSADNGRTWEVNWVADDTRTSSARSAA